MIRTLIQLLKTGNVTQKTMFPDLPSYSRGLPMLTSTPCADGCVSCMAACPTGAIVLSDQGVTLDRGLCIACGDCADTCGTGTIMPDRRTAVAVRNRADLVLTTTPTPAAAASDLPPVKPALVPFHRSLHVREVSTGDNASDLEMIASNNPIFDASRFGIHVVASPRFADALVVTGPVARAMREPLRRCWEAMAEPRVVIAAGTSAISGGLHGGGYAKADGVDAVVDVDVYIPGSPPHPWSMIHGLMLAMGHKALE